MDGIQGPIYRSPHRSSDELGKQRLDRVLANGNRLLEDREFVVPNNPEDQPISDTAFWAGNEANDVNISIDFDRGQYLFTIHDFEYPVGTKLNPIKVDLINEGNEIKLSKRTNNYGQFTFSSNELPAGSYRINLSAS